MKWLYKFFEKDFAKYYVEQQYKDKGDEDLVFRFTDKDGKKYYGYSDQVALPYLRFAKLQEYLMFYSAGLNGDTLEWLVDKADKALEEGIVKMEQGKRVNAIKIGAVLQEIRQRKDMIRPVELFMNIVAIQIVREDENPKVFNEAIHLQKVEQMIQEGKEGNTFFLDCQELKRLLNYQSMSQDEWIKYLEASKKEMEKAKEATEQYL